MKLKFEILADGKKISEYVEADGYAECLYELNVTLNASYCQWEIVKIKKAKKGTK